MYYTESIRASYVLYIVHDVNAGWGKVRAPGDAHKYLLPMSRLDTTHMKYAKDWMEPKKVPSD